MTLAAKVAMRNSAYDGGDGGCDDNGGRNGVAGKAVVTMEGGTCKSCFPCGLFILFTSIFNLGVFLLSTDCEQGMKIPVYGVPQMYQSRSSCLRMA